jgi:hypothetical protein
MEKIHSYEDPLVATPPGRQITFGLNWSFYSFLPGEYRDYCEVVEIKNCLARVVFWFVNNYNLTYQFTDYFPEVMFPPLPANRPQDLAFSYVRNAIIMGAGYNIDNSEATGKRRQPITAERQEKAEVVPQPLHRDFTKHNNQIVSMNQALEGMLLPGPIMIPIDTQRMVCGLNETAQVVTEKGEATYWMGSTLHFGPTRRWLPGNKVEWEPAIVLRWENPLHPSNPDQVDLLGSREACAFNKEHVQFFYEEQQEALLKESLEIVTEVGKAQKKQGRVKVVKKCLSTIEGLAQHRERDREWILKALEDKVKEMKTEAVVVGGAEEEAEAKEEVSEEAHKSTENKKKRGRPKRVEEETAEEGGGGSPEATRRSKRTRKEKKK